MKSITNLQYRMISDYTERVQRLQRGSCTSKLMIDVVNYIRHHISEPITVGKMAKALFMNRPYLSRKFKEETGESLTDFILYEKTEECTSKLMIDVVNYIRHHISEPITVEKMAEALFMSRPYLSRKFKEETGESLTDFILYEKTEEAKRLLRYSDKPITAISSYLGFSSPSHFSRVFKARVCITPGEYREKHQ